VAIPASFLKDLIEEGTTLFFLSRLFKEKVFLTKSGEFDLRGLYSRIAGDI